MTPLASIVIGLLALAAGSRPAFADICALDAWSNGQATPPPVLYPNWKLVRAGSFDVWLCRTDDGCVWVGAETLRSLTLVNFGSAGPSDLVNVVWKASCGATSSGLMTMTYAGVYAEDSGTYGAWTWNGVSPDFSACADLCGVPTCGGYFTIDVYVDVVACPAADATVSMGFPVNSANDPVSWGSIYDSADCVVPWADLASGTSTIMYTFKRSAEQTVVPGDTITYTIYYGKPGTAALTSIEIVDSLPPFTHYVAGSAVPAADLGYDPLVGSPSVLRWTITPVIGNLPAWGPTNEIRFSLSADWGNGEAFEPGSGDYAAPEGQRLNNTAQVFFNGTSCASKSMVNPPVSTAVKRFLFWSVGDNDILFSPAYGQSADEMIYTVFVRNISTTKTWWDVHLWDTVPADLDVWAPDSGFEDPCAGWTMTPSGCAAAYPGKTVSAGKTVMTWRLDMPPQYTLQLRWKAKVSPGAQANGTVINAVSLLAYGKSGISGGSGYSGVPRCFVHLAPIVPPSMYTSYVGYGMGELKCPGYFIFFEPLNKKAQFDLRGFFGLGAGWAASGGVSASIGELWGTCLTGFPAGGMPGCKAERAPAQFNPTGAVGYSTDMRLQCPDEVFPRHYLHKITANAPILWQLLTFIGSVDQDNHVYAPATTLSYTGLIHYMWKRETYPGSPGPPGNGDCLSLINTSVDAYGVYQPNLETSVYEFKWNYAASSWDLWRTYDIAPESQAYDMTTDTGQGGPYRTISSQGQLIINQGVLTNPLLAGGGLADNEGAFMPTRETGRTVSAPGQPANFYGICQGASNTNKVVIGNLGTTDAVFRIWRYTPDNMVPPLRMPPWLNGTSGTWQLKGTQTVPAGLFAAGNPRVYSAEGAFFDQSNTLVLSKIELISGGPIQVLSGVHVNSLWAGGSVIHSADGSPSGQDFWLHYQVDEGAADAYGARSIYTIDVFCPKSGMVVNLTSGTGITATYTTTLPDQCVSFLQDVQWTGAPSTNYRIRVMPSGVQGNVVCQYIAQSGSEKGYTAPFVTQGVHYEIVSPLTVTAGQNFWITVLVKDASGSTKTDYVGTTSFTSTDPLSRINSAAMDSYNYTWLPVDGGVKVFVNVMFSRVGSQTIVAMDTADGSINGLAAVNVVAVTADLTGWPRLQVAASSDTVQFKVCWSNYSSASGFTFTMTDAVPRGTAFLPEVSGLAFDCGNTDGVAVSVAYSTSNSPTAPPASMWFAGNPIAGTRWLRWSVPRAGVQTTGCVCFRVKVD